jgi:hypothetical protein
MSKLLTIFAAGDTTGTAKRLFDLFLARQLTVGYFEDRSLNAAAMHHPHMDAFCKVAVGIPSAVPIVWAGGRSTARACSQTHSPGSEGRGTGHQPNDHTRRPGCARVHDGDKTFSTGDFDNGLGLMINGVQHVYVLATHYLYDVKAASYCIRLRFLFYDVFGLDDKDLETFGADSTSNIFDSKIGITAWWQLQHQFGFAPLVTRIILDRSFEGAAK